MQVRSSWVTILAAQWKKRFASVTAVGSYSMTDPHSQRIIVFFISVKRCFMTKANSKRKVFNCGLPFSLRVYDTLG